MKTPMRISFLLVAVAALGSVAALAEGGTGYGEPLSEAQPVRIAELLAEPDRYLGRTVKVEGLVDDVCPMKGCWMDILEARSETTLRFKVEDDVIVFPAEAKGSAVVAEGVLRRQDLTHEQAVAWMRHLAEEKGEPFDAASVEGPMVLYRLDGVGAEISEPNPSESSD